MSDLYVRGEGGSIIPMDLPLPEDIAQRYDSGALVRVNADGSPWVDAPPAPAVPVKPKAPRKPRAASPEED
jgi:hypothetical protein